MFRSLFSTSSVTKAQKDYIAAEQEFAKSIEKKDSGNVIKLVKKYNSLLDIKNEEGVPYLFIMLPYTGLIELMYLVQNLTIDISKITNMQNDNILIYAMEYSLEIAHHIIQNLAKYNIDVNHANNMGYTALHNAARKNQLETVHVLLFQPTININQQTNAGWTALHIATYFHHRETFESLLKQKNININLQNKNRESPLHFAVYDNHLEAAKLLMENHSIDINIRNRENKTVYSYAVQNGSHEIVTLLKLKAENNFQLNDMNQIKPLESKPESIANKNNQLILSNTDLNACQIESSIKLQEKEIKALKIKLKIKKREDQLQEIQKKQAEMESIEFELQTLSNSMTNKEKEIADIKEAIKAKEGIYDHLSKEKLDISEKENEITKLKESLNHITDLPDENIDNECPICFHLMLNKKIYQCSKGHYYCEICKANIQICPYCCEDISESEIRNIYIEQLLAKMNINE